MSELYDKSNLFNDVHKRDIDNDELFFITELLLKTLHELPTFDSLDSIKYCEQYGIMLNLNEYIGYPFISQYFFTSFEFLKRANVETEYSEYADYKDTLLPRKIKSLSDGEMKIINSVGCEVKGNDELILTSEDNETDKITKFIITALSSLSLMLFKIRSKLDLNRKTYYNRYKKAIQQKTKDLKGYENERISRGYKQQNSIEKELSEELKELNEPILLLDEQINIVSEKINLVNDSLKICYKTELINTRKRFSKRLYEVTTKRGITRQMIKSWLGVKDSTVSDYFKGKTLPDTMKLRILCQMLNVDIGYLLNLSDIKNQRSYPIYEVFEQYGFSGGAFDLLDEMKSRNSYEYSKKISILNFILEETELKTFNSIVNYFFDYNNDESLSITYEDVDKLKTNVLECLKKGNNIDNIEETFEKFRRGLTSIDIKANNIASLLTIQENIESLKTQIKNSFTPAELNEKIEQLNLRLWEENNRMQQEEDEIDLEETYFYNEENW
jgi:transcriptional regulator with XRE-family HTH domain